MEEPKCPANYFGRGRNFNLPDDQEFLHRYEQEWREWETAHPDDPLGELALAKYDEWVAANPTTKPSVPTTGGKAIVPAGPTPVGFETAALQLELDPKVIEKFKSFCKLHRKRPRDMFTHWVNTLCNL